CAPGGQPATYQSREKEMPMPAPAPRPAHDRWCHADGTHISLFCRVEQVEEIPEPRTWPARMHQQGQVLGRSLDSLYVGFADDALVNLPPHLLRLLPDTPSEC
ncbi:MAG: hypothetical protein ACRDTA_13255, partial [Pseudonocardiaceae bacterium]